jgi:hypothetical protein
MYSEPNRDSLRKPLLTFNSCDYSSQNPAQHTARQPSESIVARRNSDSNMRDRDSKASSDRCIECCFASAGTRLRSDCLPKSRRSPAAVNRSHFATYHNRIVRATVHCKVYVAQSFASYQATSCHCTEETTTLMQTR